MFFVIEFTDRLTDYGMDILPPYIFGFRLFGLKIHLILGKFNEIFEVKKAEEGIF